MCHAGNLGKDLNIEKKGEENVYHSPDKLFEEFRSKLKERKSQLFTNITISGMRFNTNNPRSNGASAVK